MRGGNTTYLIGLGISAAARAMLHQSVIVAGYQPGPAMTGHIALNACMHILYACKCMYMYMKLILTFDNVICWPLPSNQSYNSYIRKIAGFQRGVGDHRVGQ